MKKKPLTFSLLLDRSGDLLGLLGRGVGGVGGGVLGLAGVVPGGVEGLGRGLGGLFSIFLRGKEKMSF